MTSGTPKVYLVFWGTQWGTQGTGNSRGTIEPARGREGDGSYTAVYQAPTVGSGPFQVLACTEQSIKPGGEPLL